MFSLTKWRETDDRDAKEIILLVHLNNVSQPTKDISSELHEKVTYRSEKFKCDFFWMTW